MTTGVGLWRVTEGVPARIGASAVGLEQELESWIEHDPGLLERGLVVVARQLRTEAGPLDLLAVDPQGRWVLIEIKRERLRRDVIAQAIDYASCIDRMGCEDLRRCCDAYLGERGGGTIDGVLRERGASLEEDGSGMELVIYLVGTGVDPGLERMVGYLSESVSMSIRMVTFSVFDDGSGGLMLAREIHEPAESETRAAARSAAGGGQPAPGEDELLAKADENGIGPVVRAIHDAAVEVGLYPKRYSKSFMIAPPQHKNRCLIYLPVDRPEKIRGGTVNVWIAAEAFEQYFGVSEAEVERLLGSSGYEDVDAAGAERVAAGLREMLGANGDGQGG